VPLSCGYLSRLILFLVLCGNSFHRSFPFPAWPVRQQIVALNFFPILGNQSRCFHVFLQTLRTSSFPPFFLPVPPRIGGTSYLPSSGIAGNIRWMGSPIPICFLFPQIGSNPPTIFSVQDLNLDFGTFPDPVTLL